MKLLVISSLLLATVYSSPIALIDAEAAAVQYEYDDYPDLYTEGSIESSIEWSDVTDEPIGPFIERKTHQFEAAPMNTFARFPERQMIGVLNTDFTPSDEFTDFILAYLPDITEILKEVKIANGGEMPATGNNPAHWLKMLLPLGRRYLQTRARLEGRDYLWPGEEKALNFVDRVTDPMLQFVQELSDV